MLWFQSCLNSCQWRALAKHKFYCSCTPVTGLHTRLSRWNATSCGLTWVKVGEAVVPSSLPLCESKIHISLAQSLFFGKLLLPYETVLFSPPWSEAFCMKWQISQGKYHSFMILLDGTNLAFNFGTTSKFKSKCDKATGMWKTFDSFKFNLK